VDLAARQGLAGLGRLGGLPAQVDPRAQEDLVSPVAPEGLPAQVDPWGPEDLVSPVAQAVPVGSCQLRRSPVGRS
jgi:hypothetical protein